MGEVLLKKAAGIQQGFRMGNEAERVSPDNQTADPVFAQLDSG
jgi:hypothetical protein